VIELTVLAVIGLGLFLLALTVLGLVIRAAFWVVLLPLRLIFGLLLLPLLLVKAVLGGLLFVVAGPLIVFASIVAVIILAGIFAVPLAPVLLLLFAAWMIGRGRRPALSAGPEPPRLLSS
jgi:hypothetical protein